MGACQVVLDVDCFQRVGGCVCEWEGGREEKEVREGRFGRGGLGDELGALDVLGRDGGSSSGGG